MKKSKIIISTIIPAILMLSSIYLYNTVSSPPDKPVIKLPTKYAGNIYFFYFSSEYYTFDNDTLLSKYWEREYLKNRTWTIFADNITLTIRPVDVECFGDRESQFPRFLVILNSSEYIEKVTYISDALYIGEKNGDASVHIVPSEEYSKKIVKQIGVGGDPYELITFKVQKSNFTMKTESYVHIDMRRVKEPLPYNFTAHIETKDKIYRMKFQFNLTDEPYPLINLWELYHENYTYDILGATYFCYNSTWGKAVISNHLLEGTQYYFVEKNGILSEIWSPYEVKNGRR